MRNQMIDRHALHELLWSRTDRLGRLEVKQGALADELELAFETVSRIFKELTAQGRIKKLKARQGNIGVYVIRDPKEWA